MDDKKLSVMITDHEGLKLKVYDDGNGEELIAGDTLIGHPTIGVGRNVANTATTLNSVLAKYQDRFLKLAQAKYYQRTTKA